MASDDPCARLEVVRTALASPHRFAGAPSADAPKCAWCGAPFAPIFRLDFDDPALAALDLWSGVLTLLTCLDCMSGSQTPTVWRYTDGNAELVRSPDASEAIYIADPEHRTKPARAVPLVATAAMYASPDWSVSRVGGPICWLGADGMGRRAPPCTDCGGPMPLIAQWADAHLWKRDADVVYLQNHVYAWFGCRACGIVAALQMLD